MSYLKRSGLEVSNYDRSPAVEVPVEHASSIWTGWDSIGEAVRSRLKSRETGLVAVECYPEVDAEAVAEALGRRLESGLSLLTREVFRTPAEVNALVAPFTGGDDPVFGYLETRLGLEDFLDPGKVTEARQRLQAASEKAGLRLVVGPAASLLAPEADLLVYADLPRWEAQQRQRRGETSNLGAENAGEKPSLQYKRSYFVDWRVADRQKRKSLEKWDFLLDTTRPDAPVLISGEAHLAGLAETVRRPFRVVPFFDPGPWGGQWMREICNLPDGPENYAWCFDCVPEENSLLLEFSGGRRVEVPALNLVFRHPRELLGEPVYSRFGPEFPIRFDLLDTMQGGNLSFQVHPTTEFAREHFGIPYTQDESYYLLDAEPGAVVFLGAREGTDPEVMLEDLRAANRGEAPFDDERHVARFPARRHDHFLIPAGTLHCSGSNSMVLEISATSYIFTFKLWDWNRLGLDGLPRPVNIERAAEVIQWHRDEGYARDNLVNQVEPLAEGRDWKEERTGLHPAEFIETRRHWFTGPVPHDTGGIRSGGVHVLNLVQGAEAVVESPTGAFKPFVIHFAETFILPAAVGPYTVRPRNPAPGESMATMKAFVRTRA